MPDSTAKPDLQLKFAAIDTATEACSAALYCNGEVTFRYTVEPRVHAKVLCHREHNRDRVAVAIDARMGEVYWGAYRNLQSEPELIGEEMVCPPSTVPVLDHSWTAAGTGWQSYAEQLTHKKQ